MIAALILAGGRGSRMGGADKALLVLAGQTLIGHLLPRLQAQAGAIAVSANGDPKRFAGYGRPVLADPPEHVGKGPLAGVAAGLGWAASLGASALLTAPVDTPFLPADLATRLAPGPAVATWQGRQHHLVALWPTGFGAALGGLLRRDPAGEPYRVRDALALAGARAVAFDAPDDPFLNINTPDDLDAATARAGRTSAPARPG